MEKLRRSDSTVGTELTEFNKKKQPSTSGQVPNSVIEKIPSLDKRDEKKISNNVISGERSKWKPGMYLSKATAFVQAHLSKETSTQKPITKEEVASQVCQTMEEGGAISFLSKYSQSKEHMSYFAKNFPDVLKGSEYYLNSNSTKMIYSKPVTYLKDAKERVENQREYDTPIYTFIGALKKMDLKESVTSITNLQKAVKWCDSKGNYALGADIKRVIDQVRQEAAEGDKALKLLLEAFDKGVK